MSVCRKLPDGTVQKIAGHTILLDANASEIREGIASINTSATAETHIWQINFSDPMPDTDYMVIPYFGDDGVNYGEMDVRTQWKVYDKTVTGCKAAYYSQFTSAGPHTIHYFAWKPIKLDGYTALQNKVNNPDAVPTENSTNLVESGGVWEAIKNASAVWKGTKAEWNALPAAEKQTYDLAVLLDETLVKAVDREDGTETDVANLNKIWQGAEADWEALPVTTKKVYDFAVITDVHYILSVDKSTGGTTKVANVPVYDVARNPDWANAVSITAAQLNAGYTAPSDGVIVGRWVNSSSTGAGMTINGVIVGVASNSTSGMLQCTVSSGDVIKNNGTTGTSEISFVPYKIADSISGRSPVGAVQAYYGASDPEEGNWLICDGRDTTGTAIELETVYPKLYRFLGNSNVLPDLRGEFLRGAGTNSHTGQGSGGAVGAHQNATQHVLGGIYEGTLRALNTGGNPWVRNNIDGDYVRSNQEESVFTRTASQAYNNAPVWYMSRPTNTSVNWIICAR